MERTSNDSEKTSIRLQAEAEYSRSADMLWAYYGSQPQAQLADFSKSMADVIARGNGAETERLLRISIEELEKAKKYDQLGFFTHLRNKGFFRQKIQCIDEMTVNLTIRQAQLLKDMKMYMELESLVNRCIEELEIYLEVGEERLDESKNDESLDIEQIGRLEKKLDELRMTNIIAMQSLAQLRLMYENCEKLSERLRVSINTAIPVWRMQAVIAYNLEENEKRKEIQDSLILTAKKDSKSLKRTIRKSSKRQPIDMNEVRRLSDSLQETMRDLLEIEQKEEESKIGMKGILNDTVNNTIKLHL